MGAKRHKNPTLSKSVSGTVGGIWVNDMQSNFLGFLVLLSFFFFLP